MKSKILIFVLLFLSVSYAAFAQSAKYEREKIWDDEINSMLEIDKRQTPPENAVLFVGSSSLRLWKTINRDFPKLTFINRAFGGSELEDVNFYAPRIIFPYKPKTIVLYAGDNDINSGKSAEQVLADFKNFVEIVRRDLLKTKILYISIKPSVARINLLPELQKANRLIEAETKKLKNVEFVDVASKMLDSEGKPLTDIFLEDNLHMNAKGYAIWRDVLSKYLN